MLDESLLIWRARNNEKHGGQTEVTGWHEMVDKYKDAVRYLQRQNMPLPHPDVLRKANRQVMIRYINKADDARLHGTLLSHFVNENGTGLSRTEQRQLRGRLLTRAANSAVSRATQRR